MISWHILTIGRFSRNKFWGESQSQAYRTPICTSVYINCNGTKIIVDPSLPPEQMPEIIDSRCGIKSPDEIDIVYVTHAHGDHYVGVEAFKKAKWFMPAAELELSKELTDKNLITRKFIPAPNELVPGIELISLPGHTIGLYGLKFKAAEGTVIIAGDSVMTRDFYRHREGYFNSVDFQLSTQSIDKMAEQADIIVPGHDNFFLTGATPLIYED